MVARAYNHTTAVAAAEPSGLAVSMLVSVFDPFGCGTYVPEGGFFLNDRMLGFSREPGSPNAPAPGKRPVHTLSPALFERDGRAVAIATPGADGQVQVLLQLLQALVDEDADPAEALERGRWRAVAGRVLLEEDLADTLGAGARGARPRRRRGRDRRRPLRLRVHGPGGPGRRRGDGLGRQPARVVGRGVVVAIVAAIVVLALLVGLAVVYNRLVRDRNRVRHTWADIDALLVRRAAAIPRLAAIVDAAFDHERETLEEVAQARAAVEAAGGGPTVEHGLAERRLGVAGQRLVAVAEAYPELRAQAAAADLIAALKDVEGDLSRARMVYNRTVQTYEDRRRALPGALVAGPLGFRHQPYWQPSEPIVG